MIHLTITGPYMACPIWATDSLDNEYSTFSVLMGERDLPPEYSRHRFCFTRTGRFYLPEVTGRPLRK